MPISPSVPTTWEQFRARRMKLDMSRGKPSPEQLDLSHALIDGAADAGHVARDGVDCRNYGLPAGLP